jgi:chromosome segregation ATPase
MNINARLDVHHHDRSEERLVAIQSTLKTVMTQLSSIDRRLGLVVQTQEALMSNVDDLQAKVEQLQSEVSETKETSGKALAALGALNAKVDELTAIIASGQSDAEKIAAITVAVGEAAATLDEAETALEGGLPAPPPPPVEG